MKKLVSKSVSIALSLVVSLVFLQSITTTTQAAVTPTACINITETLGLDSSGEQVVLLQKFLGFEPFIFFGNSGYGYFGANTENLLKLFQSKNSIPVTGVTDTVTRDTIKKLSCSGASPSTGVSAGSQTGIYYRGKAVDGQGVGVSGVTVELETQRTGFSALYNNKQRTTTGTDGTYTFTPSQSSQVYQTISFKKGLINRSLTLTHTGTFGQSNVDMTPRWEVYAPQILPSPRPFIPQCTTAPVVTPSVGAMCDPSVRPSCISGTTTYICK